MSIQIFEEEIISNESINTETKILINALKNKIIELSDLVSVDCNEWDHQTFVNDYFESLHTNEGDIYINSLMSERKNKG
jgi:hypothetical protein